MRGGGSSFPYQENTKDFIPQYIEMDGLTMGREFVKEQPKVIRAALDKAGLKMDDVDLCLSHQANLRLLKLLMNNLKLPWSKTSTSFQYSGNIAEASLPACLFEALQDGKLKDGSIVVFSALGAGCILAATVMRWYDFSKEKSN